MNNFRRLLKKNIVLQRLSSIKITVVCLVLLFILTFWGTIAQIDLGLYQAQERFFHSWYFLALGFFPFPGAQLVLWALFINLVCVSTTRFVYKFSHIGIVIIHIGLLTYFVSAFVTLHVVEESNVTLMEGAGTNVSSAYHDWELSVWKRGESINRQVIARDTKGVKAGERLLYEKFNFHLLVKSYFPNAQAFIRPSTGAVNSAVNDSGITSITSASLNIEPEKNIPAGVFEVVTDKGKANELLLYGGESKPTELRINGKIYSFILRHKRFPIPFVLTLKEFTKEMHPGTEIASKYQSLVQLDHEGVSREVLIYMNHPLRYKDFTFYQASYSIDSLGREYSTLAVVKNSGRLLPYVSCSITSIGLALHFILIGFTRNKK